MVASNTFLHGDALEVLKSLPDECVQMVCTSPPYYGLRSYIPDGHPDKPLEIGLEETPAAYVAKLVEVFREVRRVLRSDGVAWVNLGDSYASSGVSGVDRMHDWNADGRQRQLESGLKLTPTKGRAPTPPGMKPKDLMMIPARVAIALCDDGWYLRSDIIWSKTNAMPESVKDRPTKAHEYVFLLSKSPHYYYDNEAIKEPASDSFPNREAGVIQTANFIQESITFDSNFRFNAPDSIRSLSPSRMAHPDFFVKNCVRLATAILDVAEAQNNIGLPSFDTQIGEQLFDSDNGRLVSSCPPIHTAAFLASRFFGGDIAAKTFLHQINSLLVSLGDSDDFRVIRTIAEMLNAPMVIADSDAAVTIDNTSKICKQKFSSHSKEYTSESTTLSTTRRNKRSVWSLPTVPFPGSHFAVMAPKLAETCILAGTSPQACEHCAAPWQRVTTVERILPAAPSGNAEIKRWNTETRQEHLGDRTITHQKGWQPSCTCTQEGTGRCIVLDPFSGAGTTAYVAMQHGRQYIGVELNPEYIEMAEKRLDSIRGLWETIA